MVGGTARGLAARVRYAPSPTGELHLGGLRTALFNWLFARQHPQGAFLVRIEDTDQSREVPGAAERLLATLARFGIEPDLAVERQSARKGLHQAHAQRLVEQGGAYPCFCSPERLAQVRSASRSGLSGSGPTVAYDRRCRGVPVEQARERVAGGEPHTIRLKAPLAGSTVVEDLVHGTVHFDNQVVGDQILLKSDGFPTYHLASVVDDHDMGITHVIRGEEWLSSAPKHLMLYDLLGWEPPRFAHLPLLLNTDGSKLSKRHKGSAVDDLLDELGYSPEAVLNFVALLGWSPARGGEGGAFDGSDDGGGGDSDEEALIFTSKDALVEAFDLAQAKRKGAMVDMGHLHWMSAQHLRRRDRGGLLASVRETRPAAGDFDDPYLLSVIELVLLRAGKLAELHDLVDPFLTADVPGPWSADDRARAVGSNNPHAGAVLEAAHAALRDLDGAWASPALKKVLSGLPKRVPVPEGTAKPKTKDVMLPVRLAALGTLKGAELPQSLELLGRERTLARLAAAMAAVPAPT